MRDFADAEDGPDLCNQGELTCTVPAAGSRPYNGRRTAMSSPSLVLTTSASAARPRFLEVDERVPPVVKKLLDEADGCLQNSFTTGGSACARQAIRTIVQLEHADATDYATSLLTLSEKHPAVPPALFQILAMLGTGDEQLTPDALRALVVAVKAIVYEIYVLGAERVERLMYVHQLVEALKRDK
jgi:hypothetical protein